MLRIFTLFFLALIAFALPVVAISTLAFAQAPSTSVNVGALLAPWLEMLVASLATLVTALVGFAAQQLRKRTGIAIEQSHRDAIQTALTNAAGLLVARVGNRLDNVNVDVRSAAVRDAILYVNAAAPMAVRYFDLTPELLAQKLTAKLGVVGATARAELPL